MKPRWDYVSRHRTTGCGAGCAAARDMCLGTREMQAETRDASEARSEMPTRDAERDADTRRDAKTRDSSRDKTRSETRTQAQMKREARRDEGRKPRREAEMRREAVSDDSGNTSQSPGVDGKTEKMWFIQKM